MSSPLSLDDHRCPGCGRVARVVRHIAPHSPDADVGDGETVHEEWPAAGWGPAYRLSCRRCIGRDYANTMPMSGRLLTLRERLLAGCPIGPGLGRLLVEALERLSVVAGPSRDEIRATLRRLPADELLEWAVIGASPPVPNCGHRGPDGCCNYPGHVSAECHAGVPCPLVTIASGHRLTPSTPCPAPSGRRGRGREHR